MFIICKLLTKFAAWEPVNVYSIMLLSDGVFAVISRSSLVNVFLNMTSHPGRSPAETVAPLLSENWRPLTPSTSFASLGRDRVHVLVSSSLSLTNCSWRVDGIKSPPSLNRSSSGWTSSIFGTFASAKSCVHCKDIGARPVASRVGMKASADRSSIVLNSMTIRSLSSAEELNDDCPSTLEVVGVFSTKAPTSSNQFGTTSLMLGFSPDRAISFGSIFRSRSLRNSGTKWLPMCCRLSPSLRLMLLSCRRLGRRSSVGGSGIWRSNVVELDWCPPASVACTCNDRVPDVSCS